MNDTDRQYQTLRRVGELTGVLLERAFAQTEAAEGSALIAAAAFFEGLARGVRLTIALELRVAAFARQLPLAVERTETEHLETERPERPERDRAQVYREDLRERERETETDGHAATPLGRIEALQSHIAAAPDLDPDGRISAEVIELKAYLAGPPPAPPSGPPPSSPQAAFDPPTAGPGRPPNRAERRRLRHASG